MPDTDDPGDNSTIRDMREHIKVLEAEAKQHAEAAAAAQAAQRELAFLKAGVDLDAGPGRLLAKAYDGELTPDAIRAAATEYGIVQPTTTTTATPAEQAAWKQMSANAAAGQSANAGDIDWTAKINACQNETELRAVMAQAEAAHMG